MTIDDITIIPLKTKVRMRFWLRVMVARLAPPHGSRILTEETPVNMQKTQLECGAKIGKKM